MNLLKLVILEKEDLKNNISKIKNKLLNTQNL